MKLKQIQEDQPQWKVREHPDFNSWIGGGVRQLVQESAISVSRIEEMSLEELQAERARLAEVTDPFGDSSKDGFLQEIARTAEANFAWFIGIAREALATDEPSSEIWSALLRGCSSPHDTAQWTALLPVLADLEPVYHTVLYEVTSLLKTAIDRKEGGMPRELLNEALTIANSIWKVRS